VAEEKQGWFTTRFARLSTARKMFLFLWLGLLPLGIIAILASIQSARDNRAERREEISTRVHLKAQRIDAALSRASLIISAAGAAVSVAPTGGACQSTLQRLGRGRFALYSGNRPICASPGFEPPAAVARPPAGSIGVELGEDQRSLRLAVFNDGGDLQGYGEFSRDELARLSDIPGTLAGYDLVLSQGARRMVLRNDYQRRTFEQEVDSAAPVAGGRLRLAIHTGAPPISAAEGLMIFLPIIMWIAASLIGLWIVDRFLLRPLGALQRAVSAYSPGDRKLDLPRVSSPAREIDTLASAFDQVTQTIARHEAELEAAVERQTRLVREVHHRVKNNLQVVASLLNLHARGATGEDVAAAYASIQRRVDALAVVHRNHYAELEENRGVAMKPLISELGANLRATAPATASQMQIRLRVEPFYVTQDVAVSVAFMITELVEFAMFCGAESVTISLDEAGPKTALLAIESRSLKSDVICDEKLFERFDRIVTGLARQLRSSVQRDTETGRYALEISVVDKGDR
jgi:two-component sensor histidine kinase